MTDFALSTVVVVIGAIWIGTSILTFVWIALSYRHEARDFEDSREYRPHREGNVIAFRRR